MQSACELRLCVQPRLGSAIVTAGRTSAHHHEREGGPQELDVDERRDQRQQRPPCMRHNGQRERVGGLHCLPVSIHAKLARSAGQTPAELAAC